MKKIEGSWKIGASLLQSVVFWIGCWTVAGGFLLEGEAAIASISEWELNSYQSLHLSIKVISKRSQSFVDRVEERMEAIRQEMIRERPELADSMYLAADGTWRSGPVSLLLSSAYQF